MSIKSHLKNRGQIFFSKMGLVKREKTQKTREIFGKYPYFGKHFGPRGGEYKNSPCIQIPLAFFR